MQMIQDAGARLSTAKGHHGAAKVSKWSCKPAAQGYCDTSHFWDARLDCQEIIIMFELNRNQHHATRLPCTLREIAGEMNYFVGDCKLGFDSKHSAT